VIGIDAAGLILSYGDDWLLLKPEADSVQLLVESGKTGILFSLGIA
jgi:hypothetical protein